MAPAPLWTIPPPGRYRHRPHCGLSLRLVGIGTGPTACGVTAPLPPTAAMYRGEEEAAVGPAVAMPGLTGECYAVKKAVASLLV